MKQSVIILLIVLAGILTACSTESTTTLNVVERSTSDTRVDVGPDGESVGDMIVFINDIYDSENEVKVGTSNGYCVSTEVALFSECVVTSTFDGGQITTVGRYVFGRQFVVSIAGGTGEYSGARGQATIKLRNQQGTEWDVIFEIIQ